MAKARRCSFCGKAEEEGAALVAGPGVFICDACVRLAYDIIDEELGRRPPKV